MKRLQISAFIIFFLVNISAVFAQENIRTHNILSAKIPHDLWDMNFLYFASLNNTDLGNAGVAYIDSRNEIWTSKWNSNQFYRWTAHQNGIPEVLDSVYSFTVNGVSNVRGMTYDGSFVYAVNNSDTVFKISPVSFPTLVGIIIVPIAARYITFDPTANESSGGFWIGNFETDAMLIDYNGNVTDMLFYNDLGTTVIYGAAFDNYSQNGPYLWFFGQNSGYGFPQTISQVSLQTGAATGVFREVNSDIAAYTDSALAGGLFIASKLVQGKVILGGIAQCPEKDLLFGYEVGTTSFVPVSFLLNKTFSFGDYKLSSSYRIVGLPGNINLPVSQLVSSAGEHRKGWNVFYDNGQAANYLVEYNNSAEFMFRPGRAFWILSKNLLNISQQVNSVTPDLNNNYSISLHEGWNLISNPFNTPVNWNVIQNENFLGNNEVIYAWNGSWNNPAAMQPYEGYYYNNINNLTSLSIPFISGSILGKTGQKADYGLDKYIKISLGLDGREYSAVYASVKTGSQDDYDSNDYFIPPSDFSELNLFIRNSKLRTRYKKLFIDSRPEISEGQDYNLTVKNLTGKEPLLKFTGLENFKDYEVYLIDNVLNRFYNLKEKSEVKLNSFHKEYELSLFIGKESFIEQRKRNSTPEDFLLQQNYPNPFNPSTIISYELPSKSQVELKVFDLIGREVAILVNEEQPSGRYEVSFNADNLYSGVYFYTLKAGSFVRTQKMILLR